MEQARRSTTDTSPGSATVQSPTRPSPAPRSADNVVALASASVAAAAGRDVIAGLEPVGKWPGVLERVRGAADYIRGVEDRAQEQETRVQDLLDQVRADMQEATAKVQAAEAYARDSQAQAHRLIQAAEERARLAEARAATAEGWLIRISEAIETEFVMERVAPERSTTS